MAQGLICSLHLGQVCSLRVAESITGHDPMNIYQINKYMNVGKEGGRESRMEPLKTDRQNLSGPLCLLWGKSETSLGTCSKVREVGVGTFINPAQCVLEPTAGHTMYAMLSQGKEKLDTRPHTTSHWSRSTSDTSSHSSITTEEDEEGTEMHLAVRGRDKVTREHNGHESVSEGPADYQVATQDNTVVIPGLNRK